MNETTELFKARREQLEKAVTDSVLALFGHMSGAAAFVLDMPHGEDADIVVAAGPVKDVKDMLRIYKPERWDLPTSDPMADVEAGMRLDGRCHDPATSCAHDDKEECDDCNDCGAVLGPNGEVKP